MKTGSELIAEERARQISQEGWTPEHDDKHTHHELIHASSSYLLATAIGIPGDSPSACFTPPQWPWERAWWKPADPICNLTKAGALIAAEIDRLQRLAVKK